MAVRRHERARFRWLGLAVASLSTLAYAQAPVESVKVPPSGLTPEELAAEPPPLPSTASQPWMNPPVTPDKAIDVRLELSSESGYVEEFGRYVVDLLEQDYAYIRVQVLSKDSRPVMGAAPDFSVEGTSRLLEPEALAAQTTTDEFGVIEFAVVGGQMGLDRVRVEFGEASTEVLVNVISLEAAGFPAPPVVEGGLPWEELTKARVRYQDTVLVTEFPEGITARAGQTVKLSGFMMPLESELKQHRFLLTSNPPSCFFHLPGGPAGAVEVFAEEGVEMSWDPVVLEGRFEPQQTSAVGVVYRLHDARLVTP